MSRAAPRPAPRGVEPYADGLALVDDALAALDEALAAVVAGERAAALGAPDARLRGLVVTDGEVDALLGAARARAAAEPAPALGGHLWARVAPRLEATRARDVALPLDVLRDRFALGVFEVECLLVCLAVEVDTKYERVFGYLNDDVTRRTPSVQLLLRLLTPPGDDPVRHRRALTPDATLLRAGLLAEAEETRGGGGGYLRRCLRVEPGVVRYLLGEPGLDPAFDEVWHERGWAPRAPELWAGAGALPALRDALAARRTHTGGWRAPLVCVLRGRDGSGRRFAAETACRELGLGLLPLDCARLLRCDQPEAMLRRVFRDSLLYAAPVLLAGADALLEDRERGPDLRAAVDRAMRERGWLLFVCTEGELPGHWLSAVGQVEVAFVPARGAAEERAAHWRALLADAADEAPALDPDTLADDLAAKFRLTAGQIARAFHRVAEAPASEHPLGARLHAAAAHVASPTLGQLAQQVTPVYGWDDLVLPERQTELLRDAVRHVRFRRTVWESWRFARASDRGTGVTVLLSGPSGTGKSMAAQVLATELGMALYRIDLSSVVSKYIGETEKNLARIFREAEHTDAILFFDEADALFGKRSEVRDAHDRYANIEINYLLQQMEQYAGVAILATNQRQSMDEAFLRRIQVAIECPLPTPADRLRIWERALPAAAPRAADVDFPYLARSFELSGGNIRNIAVAAAFLAAESRGAITTEHLVRATHRELAKIGRRGGANGTRAAQPQRTAPEGTTAWPVA